MPEPFPESPRIDPGRRVRQKNGRVLENRFVPDAEDAPDSAALHVFFHRDRFFEDRFDAKDRLLHYGVSGVKGWDMWEKGFENLVRSPEPVHTKL